MAILEYNQDDDIQTDVHGRFFVLRIAGIQQTFRWIPDGSFLMGSPDKELSSSQQFNDEYLHEVTISKGFWLADTAVTQEQWSAVMEGSNPSAFEGEKNPVETVSWNETQIFLKALNLNYPKLKARLPTEAEWEYACRATTTTPFYFGDSINTNQVNFDGNHPFPESLPPGEFRRETLPVKSMPANAWGLYDMHGNVWEWCSDNYEDYPRKAVLNPHVINGGPKRVIRGGSWYYSARYCRSASRVSADQGNRNGSIGFRIVVG